MKQIHIYVQEVVGGDKIVYTTEQKTSNPKEISDIRVELQQLQVSTEQTVLRVAYSFSHVCITIAKPSRLGRSGDYEAVWVLIPRESVYSAVEGGHFAEVIRDLESRIKSVSRPLWSELKAMDVEIDSPKGQIRASNELAGLAYRLYDEAEGYDELLKKLVQSEYSEYKAVYFLPRNLKPVGAVAKELTNPLKSTCTLQPPAEPLGSVRLFVDEQVLSEAKRYSSGQRLRVRWDNPPYDSIEQTITIEPGKEVLRLTKPEKKKWKRSLDLAITPTFAGQPVHGARMTINGEEPKAKYSQEEWEQGLKLSFQHPDYQGDELVLNFNNPAYKFKKRELNRAFFKEYGLEQGQSVQVDGEVVKEGHWVTAEWWQSSHDVKVSTLRLGAKSALEKLCKKPSRITSTFKQSQHQNTGGDGEEERSGWNWKAIIIAVSMVLGIGIGGYFLYDYLTPSTPKQPVVTDSIAPGDTKEDLIKWITEHRSSFREQVYEKAKPGLVKENKELYKKLDSLGQSTDLSSEKLEALSLERLMKEKQDLGDSIDKVENYAEAKLEGENKILKRKIDSVPKANGSGGSTAGTPISGIRQAKPSGQKGADPSKPSGSRADNGQ